MYVHHFVSPVHSVLGPGDRLCLWTTGCPRRCEHCISPELQIKENGFDIDVKTLFETLKLYLKECDGVTISGGEPFWQPQELHELISLLRSSGVDDILVYTGYERSEIDKRFLNGVTAIIDGAYLHSLNTRGSKPWGSLNQKLHVLEDTFRGKYAAWQRRYPQRTLQNFNTENGVFSVGMHDLED